MRKTNVRTFYIEKDGSLHNRGWYVVVVRDDGWTQGYLYTDGGIRLSAAVNPPAYCDKPWSAFWPSKEAAEAFLVNHLNPYCNNPGEVK